MIYCYLNARYSTKVHDTTMQKEGYIYVAIYANIKIGYCSENSKQITLFPYRFKSYFCFMPTVWQGSVQGGTNITLSEQTCQKIRSKLYMAADKGVNSAFGTPKA